MLLEVKVLKNKMSKHEQTTQQSVNLTWKLGGRRS